jgi:DNA-binding MarR family transcriptional regulator
MTIRPEDQQPLRAAVEDAIRRELDALGARLSSFREAANAEIERLAALRWVTELAGLRPNEVAERAGVSRQTLVNLRSAGRGTDYQWPPDLRVLLELGLRGPRTNAELVESIGEVPVSAYQVTNAVERLSADGLIAEAARAAARENEPVVYWRLAARGVEELPRRLRHAAMPPSREWTAYVVSSTAEANAIAAAGEHALGEHGTVVIPAGTVHGMARPEVAFRVEAADPHSAIREAVALFGELRRRAGMTPRQEPIIVSALVPPKSSPAPTP